MELKNEQSVEFVYFDLGNVLLSFDPDVACRNLAERFSISIDQARGSVYQSGLQDQFEHGQVTPEQFVDAIRRQLGRSVATMPTSDVLDAISDMFTPIESMRSVMHGVREAGCRVGLLSNTCHAHWDWIVRQQYSVMNFDFDAVILSFQVGAMKPDEAIYHAAEQQAEVQATEILFLDDKQENVAAASLRGWQAVQCLGGDQAIAALKSFRLTGEFD